MNKSFLKFITDFGPLLIFFTIYYKSGNNLSAAIPPLIIATIIALSLVWILEKKIPKVPLFSGILKNEGEKAHFYFVHSFFSKPDDHRVVFGETMHGEVFASVISSEYVFATQFHPEKSSENGILLLKNFAGWNP